MLKENIKLNLQFSNETTKGILNFIFASRPVEIIKAIAATGRSNVPWLHWKCRLSGRKLASFVPIKQLIRVFWMWLESINVMALAVFERIAISEIIYRQLQVGDDVWLEDFGWAKIIEKERSVSLNLPRFWIETKDAIEKVEPCYCRFF